MSAAPVGSAQGLTSHFGSPVALAPWAMHGRDHLRDSFRYRSLASPKVRHTGAASVNRMPRVGLSRLRANSRGATRTSSAPVHSPGFWFNPGRQAVGEAVASGPQLHTSGTTPAHVPPISPDGFRRLLLGSPRPPEQASLPAPGRATRPGHLWVFRRRERAPGRPDFLCRCCEAAGVTLAASRPLRQGERHALVRESSVSDGPPWPGTRRIG